MALSKQQQRVLVETLWIGAKELTPIPGVKAGFAMLEHMQRNWPQEQIPVNDEFTADILKREQQVLRATQKLETVHVMKIEGSSFNHEPPYLVFAYYPGGDLANWIERRRASGGIGWERALVAFKEMAEGLSLAHAQGIEDCISDASERPADAGLVVN